jgi:sugar phosphate isomerase/epimerase
MTGMSSTRSTLGLFSSILVIDYEYRQSLIYRPISANVEFEGWQNVDPSSLAKGNQAWIEELSLALAESEMAVCSLNCGLSQALNDPEPAAYGQYQAEFQALLGLSRLVDCPNITIQPGNPRPDTELGRSLELVAARLSELAGMCGDSGVTLGVEAHQGSILEDPKEALHTIRQVWPAAGLTYDPSHFIMQGIPLSETEPLLDYSVHVHVRNASPGNMQETMLEGVVDFPWLIWALEKNGYTGPVTIEYFRGFDPDFANVLALRGQLLALEVKPGPA